MNKSNDKYKKIIDNKMRGILRPVNKLLGCDKEVC